MILSIKIIIILLFILIILVTILVSIYSINSTQNQKYGGGIIGRQTFDELFDVELDNISTIENFDLLKNHVNNCSELIDYINLVDKIHLKQIVARKNSTNIDFVNIGIQDIELNDIDKNKLLQKIKKRKREFKIIDIIPPIASPEYPDIIDEIPDIITSSNEYDNNQDEILCLVHGTSLEHFTNILEMGHIIAQMGEYRMFCGSMELINKGAFFSLILNCNINKSINSLCANDIILVFSKKILSHPYHISNNWCGGVQFAPMTQRISLIVQTYDNVHNYIQNTSCFDNLKNEVVFTENIPLDSNLLEIWICDMKNMSQRISIKQADGSYSRAFKCVPFSPNQIKTQVEKMLQDYNIVGIPVKITKTIQQL